MGCAQHAVGTPARPPRPNATRGTMTQPEWWTFAKHTQNLDKPSIRRRRRRHTKKTSSA